MPDKLNRSSADPSSADRDPRGWLKESDVAFLREIGAHGKALYCRGGQLPRARRLLKLGMLEQGVLGDRYFGLSPKGAGFCSKVRSPAPETPSSVEFLINKKILALAGEEAGRSPCVKSRRGVVIFDERGRVLSRGHNRPPAPFRCRGDDECRHACNKVAVHAEAAALLALGPAARSELHLLHLKVEDGKGVPSGPPSCWQCSRLILAAGIGWVWLLHAEGLKSYRADEFHAATLEQCGIPYKRDLRERTR